MTTPSSTPTPADAFIERWSRAEASERANAQLFLSELSDLLEVPRPSNTHADGYTFEFPVKIPLRDGSLGDGRIDLYRRDAFVLEAKQYADSQNKEGPKSDSARVMDQAGVYLPARKSGAKNGPVRGSGAWDDAMMKARGQAERYARSLPDGHATPPFLLVADIGHTIELYADFTQAGKAYLPYPDPRTFRIRLSDLAEESVRDRLRQVWLDPLSLDPSKISAAVTREIADLLAALAASLERSGHPPKLVGEFLTRCLFCMFAEDVGLLPKDGFRGLLESIRTQPEGFVPKLRQLFSEMQTGTEYSVILNQKLLRFSGGLFEEASVLPLDAIQIEILIQAAAAQWKNVEPAIFGTLLERALDPEERHALGAHYTPRAYVERLIIPTIVEPLRSTWESVRTAAVVHAQAGRMEDARKEIRAFHDQLCKTTILDPACGSGNFLYVALEHLKRLEGEVLDASVDLGENLLLDLSTHSVDPHQFLGIELNPRAASIAEMVLWIGYLQWHFRTRGQTLPEEPVLRRFHNIECRDALLAWDGEPQPVLDESGQTVTIWDRKSKKTDPVTGREVPDESKRSTLLSYPNPRPAEWPKADYIVGNPPFLGPARMREDLGDGYTETLRKAYPEVPESADFVMYWWEKAARAVEAKNTKRFGFITTNSLRQTFNRRVLERHLGEISLRFAIPDHPWVDTQEGAAVRIAMTVAAKSDLPGQLLTVTEEEPQPDGSAKVTFTESKGEMAADLTIGAKVSETLPLRANDGLTYRGMCLFGDGFIIAADTANQLGLGTIQGLEKHIRSYRNGRDLTDKPRGVYVIDLYGLSVDEARQQFPSLYQHLLTNLKPERDANRDKSIRENWWIFGRPRPELRPALQGLSRYIASVETSKHRHFQFLDGSVLPDNMLIAIASDDAFHLGVLSSRIHVAYALAAGGTLEDRPRYNKSRCFDPFPFPNCDESKKSRIRSLAEELDVHRKCVQAEHPTLTLTGIYNVLEALREGFTLTAKEKAIHDQGLVSVLRQLHDDLDTAVAEAYGWPADLSDEEILTRLVALNAERATEEAQGVIRYLRPEYQKPSEASVSQSALSLSASPRLRAKTLQTASGAKSSSAKTPWPKPLAERVRAVEEALRSASAPVTAKALSKTFARASASDIQEILDTLVTLGRIHQTGESYSA
ncbi:MAG: DNA methyltransferase [Chthoniobacterales bacterium]